MNNRLRRFAGWVFLFAGAGLLFLWPLSYFRGAGAAIQFSIDGRALHSIGVDSRHGSVSLSHVNDRYINRNFYVGIYPYSYFNLSDNTHYDKPGPYCWMWLGFKAGYKYHDFLDISYNPSERFIEIIGLPHWVLFIGCIWLAWRNLRRRPSPCGTCRKCSYDIRAHHPGDKCPECGTTILKND